MGREEGVEESLGIRHMMKEAKRGAGDACGQPTVSAARSDARASTSRHNGDQVARVRRGEQ